MSIIGSPFDLSADIFTQKYAAQDDGQGQQGGQATNDFQSSGSYSTSCQALKAWRNCEISTSELKTVVLEINNDAPSWNDNDWDDFILNDCWLVPNNRNQEATAGAWGEWSDCAPNLNGDGMQNRQREIVKPKLVNCVEDKLHGLSLLETRECELPVEEPIYGCMDSEANNYDSEATEDDGSWQYSEPALYPDEPLYGCMDSEANNYDSEATEDDGSCQYNESKDDDDDSSLGDKIKDNWMLVGAAILGLALLG